MEPTLTDIAAHLRNVAATRPAAETGERITIPVPGCGLVISCNDDKDSINRVADRYAKGYRQPRLVPTKPGTKSPRKPSQNVIKAFAESDEWENLTEYPHLFPADTWPEQYKAPAARWGHPTMTQQTDDTIWRAFYDAGVDLTDDAPGEDAIKVTVELLTEDDDIMQDVITEALDSMNDGNRAYTRYLVSVLVDHKTHPLSTVTSGANVVAGLGTIWADHLLAELRRTAERSAQDYLDVAMHVQRERESEDYDD